MDYEFLTQTLFKVAGGLAIFLFGMKNMSEGISVVGSKRLRKIISSVTDNRLMAVGAGIVITVLFQSSSLSTALVVGFVNSGIMTLMQSVGIILGANIGTTTIGWLIALNIGKQGLLLLAVGIFLLLFSKSERFHFVALVIMGLGMIFYGLELMKDGLKPLRAMPEFVGWFQYFVADTYWGVMKCALAGCVVTILVQSSSATLGITMSLAATDVIGFKTAAALVLGENLGTTATAFFASIGTKTNARRAAYAHMLFNLTGVAWITAIFPLYMNLIEEIVHFGRNTFETGSMVMTKIALVHSGFNIANTLLFLPFMPLFVRGIIRLVPDSQEAEDSFEPQFITEQSLASPELALELLKKEQFALLERLPSYMSSLRDLPSPSPAPDLETAHRAFVSVAKELNSFSAELVDKNLSLETSEEVLNIMQRQDLIVSIEEALFHFVETIRGARASQAIRSLCSNFVEGLDAILLTTIDALGSNDKIDVDMLVTITADKSELMERIHKTYLSSSSDLELSDKSSLLSIVNLFERIAWLLRKFGGLLAAEQSERAGTT